MITSSIECNTFLKGIVVNYKFVDFNILFEIHIILSFKVFNDFETSENVNWFLIKRKMIFEIWIV